MRRRWRTSPQPRHPHLRPPDGPSPTGLTTRPTYDLASQPWIPLHRTRLPFLPAAFWYVVEQWTLDHHWKRSIFAQALLQCEYVAIATVSHTR